MLPAFLLGEHLAFFALTGFAMIIWIGRIIQGTPEITNWFYRMLDRIQPWMVGLGVTPFCIISGFAVGVAFTGAFYYAYKFFLAAVYFASFAELASNYPRNLATCSRVYDFALAMIVVTPLTY